jgi:FtsP/CotA-like multicopper oxidase with cupredoxin domain
MVMFEVVNRQSLVTDDEGITLPPATLVPGTVRGPEPWETGRKDTVVVFPGEVARVRALFDIAGQFVWHCHIVSHEDNEMMRAYEVVSAP